MDLITHFLVPYIILTILKSKNKLAGAFGGISLDFDVLIAWIGILSPELFIFSHRGITHSFIFGFVTSIIFLYLLTRKPIKGFISKTIHRNINIEFNRSTIMLVYFGALTHLFLDFLTSKGIPLLYPFSITRYSAELYYYLDTITLIIAAIVLIILYLSLNPKYKKVAMASFIIILVAFGAIRSYEKFEVLQSQSNTLGNDYTHISTYPTSDMFTWDVVESDKIGKSNRVFQYNTLKDNKSNIRTFKSISIKNGSYNSAQDAINIANTLPIVERFKWNSYYTCIDAKYDSNKWDITYYDIIGSSWDRNSLKVSV